MKSIRILHVIGGVFRYGGTEAFLMNYYRHIDKTKVQFDFVVHGFEKGVYDDEIKDLGGKIYNIPIKSKDYLGNIRALKDIFKSGEYNIVHTHLDAMGMVVLKTAKKCRIPIRIAHGHSSNHHTNNKVKYALHEHARKNIAKYATHFFANSIATGKWLFGNEVLSSDRFKVIRNAINFDRYKFDNEVRESLRANLNAQNDLVIGHVGRFTFEKNHLFLLEVFNEILKQQPKSKLVLIGDGSAMTQVKDRIINLDILDNVHVLGVRQDTSELLNTFDIFILPSTFEGLGIVLIEAQANGLQCFASEAIPHEANVLNRVKYILLDKSPASWAEIILNSYELKQSRVISKDQFEKTGYEITQAAKELQDVYSSVFANLSASNLLRTAEV